MSEFTEWAKKEEQKMKDLLLRKNKININPLAFFKKLMTFGTKLNGI